MSNTNSSSELYLPYKRAAIANNEVSKVDFYNPKDFENHS
jgi:hypothetical protein